MGSDGKSLKSSFDLAMERLARRGGATAALSDAQRLALAEVDRATKAKIAELEIMGLGHLAKVVDKPEEAEKIRAGQRFEIDRVKKRAEEEKERIRRDTDAPRERS